MAIDSQNKRFSLIGFGAPVPAVFPTPDGNVDTVGERAQYVWLYAGLSLGSPVTLPDVGRTFTVQSTPRRFSVQSTPRRFTVRSP